MKFKLSPLAPQSITRVIVEVNPATRQNKRTPETFEADVVYDTEDYVARYPKFSEGVLNIRGVKTSASKQDVAKYREIYGQALTVKDCGCARKSATLYYPLFEEVEL